MFAGGVKGLFLVEHPEDPKQSKNKHNLGKKFWAHDRLLFCISCVECAEKLFAHIPM